MFSPAFTAVRSVGDELGQALRRHVARETIHVGQHTGFDEHDRSSACARGSRFRSASSASPFPSAGSVVAASAETAVGRGRRGSFWAGGPGHEAAQQSRVVHETPFGQTTCEAIQLGSVDAPQPADALGERSVRAHQLDESVGIRRS